ncbi:hypothetical protein V2J09_010408 [Rumex salicifolius]
MKQKLNQSSKVSWPKTVVKKWLNIKSGVHEFQSDNPSKGTVERRKSCSDRDCYVYIPQDFPGLVTESSEYLKAPKMRPNGSKDNIDLRMLVSTWNVGGKPPEEGLNLRDWLTASYPADIYVLGFQEIVPLNAGNVLGSEDNGPAAKWLELIRHNLRQNYQNATNCTFTHSNGHHLTEDHKTYPSKANLSSSDLLSLEGGDSKAELDCPMSSYLKPRSMSERLNPGFDSTSLLRRNNNSSVKRKGYRLAASKQMVGIFLCVWVRADLYTHVSNLRVSCVGTGIMGYLGNKGSVSISMTLYDATFCFVCTHLTSGEKEGNERKRNLDVTEILKRTRFSRCYGSGSGLQSLAPETILEHDKTIWLGDLNYRLASTWEDTFKLLVNRDWNALLEKDQLKIEQNNGRVFKGWEEGQINFTPTYKFIPNSDSYAVHYSKSKDKRTPAWCDRILWKGQGMKQLFYSSGESKFSDHRSVSSLFSVGVRTPVGGVKVSTALTSSSYNAKIQAEELLIDSA